MSRPFKYLDQSFDRLERHKDEKLSSHHGVEPTVEAVAVVWPPAPEAERLSLLMRAKAAMRPSLKASEHRGAAK